MNDRMQIDPEGRYPADGLTKVEKNAMTVLASMPGANVERTRDVFQISVGGDAGIVVVVTAEAVELRLPTVEWTKGTYGPIITSRLWKRIKWEKLPDGEFAERIEAALKARKHEFQPCKFCGNEVPPERRHGNVCHGCAERFQGIVH